MSLNIVRDFSLPIELRVAKNIFSEEVKTIHKKFCGKGDHEKKYFWVWQTFLSILS